MKDLKKSKTKTSKAKPRKLRSRKLRPRKLRPRKLRPRKLRPQIFFYINLYFRLFRNSCSLERNCLMIGSKNLENINVQLLSSFCDCPVYIFPYGWTPQPFLPKCGLFHQSLIICQCRMSEESKQFEKWRICRSRKLRPPKLLPLIFFKGKLCFRFFHNSFNLERMTRWLP